MPIEYRAMNTLETPPPDSLGAAHGSTAPTVTGRVGTNADLFPSILKMYVADGAIVADVTYGRGVFWRNVEKDKYQLKATDLQDGVNFCALPYDAASIDALILDPPYMHGGASVLTDGFDPLIQE